MKESLEGKRFGKLVVIAVAPRQPKVGQQWLCQCDCGKQSTPTQSRLLRGVTKSCGCAGNEGRKKSVAYRKARHIWRSMKDRCLRAKNKSFPYYGGRGIVVCERWMNFENFYADMGDPPEGMQIERKNNDGPYEPGNCRWATFQEQMSNRQTSHLVHYRGETRTLTEWADLLKINRQTLRNRIRAGWSIERAMTAPVESVGYRRWSVGKPQSR